MRYNVPVEAHYWGYPEPQSMLCRCEVCGMWYYTNWVYIHDDYCSGICWMMAEAMDYDEAMEILLEVWGIRQCMLWSWMNPNYILTSCKGQIYRLSE